MINPDAKSYFRHDNLQTSPGHPSRFMAYISKLSSPETSRDFSNFYVCSFCKTQHITLALYKQHLSYYHGDKLPHSCSICGKGFFSKSAHYHHKRAHEERKFECHVCSSKFVMKHHLKMHLIGVHKLVVENL